MTGWKRHYDPGITWKKLDDEHVTNCGNFTLKRVDGKWVLKHKGQQLSRPFKTITLAKSHAKAVHVELKLKAETSE